MGILCLTLKFGHLSVASGLIRLGLTITLVRRTIASQLTTSPSRPFSDQIGSCVLPPLNDILCLRYQGAPRLRLRLERKHRVKSSVRAGSQPGLLDLSYRETATASGLGGEHPVSRYRQPESQNVDPAGWVLHTMSI